VARVDPEKREDWDNDLTAPLPGQERRKPTEAVLEKEASDFMATMMQHKALTGG
jgi:hypothetical protein